MYSFWSSRYRTVTSEPPRENTGRMRPPSRGEAMRNGEANTERVSFYGVKFHWTVLALSSSWSLDSLGYPMTLLQKLLFHLSQFVLGFLLLATQSLDKQKHSDKLSSLPFMFFNPYLRPCLLILEGEEGGGDTDRERENHQSAAFCTCPDRGLNPKPRYVP